MVGIAASAGGFEALAELVPRIPKDFPVPVIVLLHRRERRPGEDRLVTFLSRVSVLPVMQASSGELPRPRTIYVAPPNCDLRLNADSCFEVSSSTASLRPSADTLFSSLAQRCESGAIGVVLSGALRDGVAGAGEIRAAGGTVLVQAPETAWISDMPRAAIRAGCADLILPPAAIADALVALTLRASSAANVM